MRNYCRFQVADQAKSPFPMTSAILIGQFDFPFCVHEIDGTSRR